MIPLPPNSPLFPFPTLFRSGPVRKGRVFLAWHGAVGGDTQHTEHGHYHAQQALVIQQAAGHQRTSTVSRSEEHTSELQSRPHLVCRLLLEKKKTNKQTRHYK